MKEVIKLCRPSFLPGPVCYFLGTQPSALMTHTCTYVLYTSTDITCIHVVCNSFPKKAYVPCNDWNRKYNEAYTRT